LLEGWGLKKLKDFFCWRYDSARPVPEAALQLAEEAPQASGTGHPRSGSEKLGTGRPHLIDVFNSAWEKNWAFVPLTENEIKKAAKDFKLLLEPKLALIAEVNGVPAGISLALPNLNEAIKDLNGRLFPFGLFKLLYRIKAKKIRSARLILLGIKKEFRKDALGAGLSVLLYVEKHRRSQELKHWGGELSWTLEDNQKINFGIEMMGGEHYKTYRGLREMPGVLARRPRRRLRIKSNPWIASCGALRSAPFLPENVFSHRPSEAGPEALRLAFLNRPIRRRLDRRWRCAFARLSADFPIHPDADLHGCPSREIHRRLEDHDVPQLNRRQEAQGIHRGGDRHLPAMPARDNGGGDVHTIP
jgi:hypothetical protein